MAERAAIEHRYSCLAPACRSNATEITAAEFYRAGAFPGTAARMELFEAQAPLLGQVAVEQLALGSERRHITHMLTTCCTGFSAPGLDQQIIARCGLPSTIERTMIGFMGCYAAINALKVARHIVRSEPSSRVLIVNLELCSLHLNETAELGELLSFLIFGDGCAASVVSADPTGFSLDRLRALSVPDTGDLITWSIRDHGFDMVLSGQVPGAILDALSGHANEVLDGAAARSIDLWAVHPGGRSVLDAVERAFNLDPPALRASREVLRRFGNMSSSTVMFVFESLLRTAARGSSGCAMAFGPGLTAETMLFRAAA
jgi:predicted naringenin-chalcone synthase